MILPLLPHQSLLNLFLFLAIVVGRGLQAVFLGPLRVLEVEVGAADLPPPLRGERTEEGWTSSDLADPSPPRTPTELSVLILPHPLPPSAPVRAVVVRRIGDVSGHDDIPRRV